MIYLIRWVYHLKNNFYYAYCINNNTCIQRREVS